MTPYEADQDADAAAIERAGVGLAVVFAGAAAVALVGWLLAGCQPRTPAEAEAAYTAEQSACVVEAHAKRLPLSAVRECREASDRKWGVALRDGGR